MLIVPIDSLTAGMVLAKDVASTSAREYRTLLMKGTLLTDEMVQLLKNKGIKSVSIVGSASNETEQHAPTAAEERQEKQLITHIGKALSQMNDIFDNGEIKELSQEAVKQIDDIADDILEDIQNDSTYLGNQMIALQTYDDYTYKHCLRVAMLSTSMAAELALPQEDIKEIVVAALLHDIGKSNIDHDIVAKPGKLTNEEFDEIKRHPYIGYEILKNTGAYNANILTGVLFHQEKYDGTGYPTGIAGKKIPLIARIITVADVFDALTSNRPYRKPWSVAETEEYMLGSCGMHFDYDVVQAFLRAFNPYPIGTIVELSDTRHGVVIKYNTNVLRPVVKILGGPTQALGEIVDLSNDFRFLSLMIKGIYTGELDSLATS